MSAKSQNGWIASKVRAEIDIDSFPIPGTKIKLTCNKAVAPLLVGLAAEFATRKAAEEAAAEAAATAKASAQAKLAALGLTADEIAALSK